MKKRSLWSTVELHAVEDKYLQNPVFDAFSGPCYTLLASQKTFGLHPSELFYQCMFIIDMIKPQGISEAQQYCLTKVGGEFMWKCFTTSQVTEIQRQTDTPQN